MTAGLDPVNTYVFGFFALRGEAADGLALRGALSPRRSLETQHGGRRHLAVQLVGEVPQDTHSILNSLKTHRHTQW